MYDSNRFEKNWSYFNYESKLFVIYRWYPISICRINFESNELHLINEKISPIEFKNFRGSSCGVWYNNDLYFLTHEVKNKEYLHTIIVFNNKIELLKYSEHFKFDQNTKIQFSYGMIIENDEIIFSYSISDKISMIGVYDYNYIMNDIKWTHV